MQSPRMRALVVGASSGIGRQVATRLVGSGADVVFAGRRTALLDEAVTAAGGGIAVTADISDEAQCDRLVAASVEALGGLDLVVVASGSSRLVRLKDATRDDWESVLRSNVVGPALLVRAALPHVPPETGVVALLSSESVGQPYPGLVPYTASKAALEEAVRGWRIEHPEHRFACVVVGSTDGTDFTRDFDLALAGELFPVWTSLGRLPARVMNAADVGTAVADTLAVAVRTPTIDVQHLVFRAPGGAYTG